MFPSKSPYSFKNSSWRKSCSGRRRWDRGRRPTHPLRLRLSPRCPPPTRNSSLMPLRAQCVLILLAMVMAGGAHAQVFRVQGGDSTLLNAEGATVEFKAPDYDGSVGLGYYNDKIQFGGNTRYLFHGYTMLAGDENIPFTL